MLKHYYFNYLKFSLLVATLVIMAEPSKAVDMKALCGTDAECLKGLETYNAPPAAEKKDEDPFDKAAGMVDKLKSDIEKQ